MKIAQSYGPNQLGLSFELFPPKTEAGLVSLHEHVASLATWKPDFMTCTYGAGGSTQEKTLQIITEVHARHRIPVASHLTCVGSTVEQLRQYLLDAHRRGVDGIVALRGDPPQGSKTFQAVDGGLHHASELVSLIRAEFPQFSIAVAGYPEKHLEAATHEDDLRWLHHKVAQGADVVITQLFYDNDDFFRFVDRCQALGIGVPIIPGILPVTNLSQIQRITSLCGARLPQTFVDRLGEHEGDDWQFQVGVEFATQQVQGLLDHGVAGLHFYVLNKSAATCQVLERTLGARKQRSPTT